MRLAFDRLATSINSVFRDVTTNILGSILPHFICCYVHFREESNLFSQKILKQKIPHNKNNQEAMKLNIPATLTCLLMNSSNTYAVDKELKATPSHLRSRRATASSNIISATPICQDDSSWFVKGNKKNEKGSKQQTTVGAPATKTCIDVASKPANPVLAARRPAIAPRYAQAPVFRPFRQEGSKADDWNDQPIARVAARHPASKSYPQS